MNWVYQIRFYMHGIDLGEAVYGVYSGPGGWGLYGEAYGGHPGGWKRNDTLTRGHDVAAMTCANATN